MEGTTIERLIIEWRADYSRLQDDLQKVKNELKGTHHQTTETASSFDKGKVSAENFGSGLKSIVTHAARAAAAIFGVKKIVGELKESIQLAMQVVEDDSLFRTALGGMADETERWAEALSGALGVNAHEIRKTTGLWFNMVRSMGLADDQALSMSKNLVQLKNDITSFYNIADERAESIIEGMITGMPLAAKQIGVVLTDEVAKRELVTAGIVREGQAVDSTTMMYGRYLALMNQTQTAHGDMARTIDSPANQLRVMQAALREARLELGQAFLPVVQTVLPWLRYLAAFIKLVANSLASFSGRVASVTRQDLSRKN